MSINIYPPNPTGRSGYSGPSGFSGYSGPSGFSGYSGRSGYSGYSGMFGGDTQPYSLNVSTVLIADPPEVASGIVYTSGVALASTTVLYFSCVNADSINIANWLAALDDSSNVPHGFLRVVNRGDSSKFVDFSITSINTAYITDPTNPQVAVTVSVVTSGNTVANNSDVLITFARAGDSGFSGYSGKSGFSGYSGPSGFSGYSGPTGTSGFSGYSGPQGTSGFSGYSGPSGFSGYSGPTGTSGFSGYSGPQGTSGFSGYSGPSGFSGYSGPSGFSGYSGPTGASGFSGYSGPSGYSGYSAASPGASGFSGYSGRSGFSGYSGRSGFSGYSGRSGFSGYSGPAASDLRLKKNVLPFTQGLDTLLRIDPVEFEFNGLWGHGADGVRRVGIIAQDIDWIFPQGVRREQGKIVEDGPSSDILQYNPFAFVMLSFNAIKELNNKIAALEARLEGNKP